MLLVYPPDVVVAYCHRRMVGVFEPVGCWSYVVGEYEHQPFGGCAYGK